MQHLYLLGLVLGKKKKKNVYRFSSICGKLGTAGKWSKIWMPYFVESYEQNPERDMILEASVTTDGYLSIVMLGEHGAFWSLGLKEQH